jgi:uncharacterized membrane protein YdjX (TVP38/TMEM64 family)
VSTEIIFLGYTIGSSIVFVLAGTFGGFFPFFYDLISRQKMQLQEKIDLDMEFYLIKALLIPLLAFVVTSFAVAFENVTTWLAAIYLGASLPILIEKVIGASDATVNTLANGQ